MSKENSKTEITGKDAIYYSGKQPPPTPPAGESKPKVKETKKGDKKKGKDEGK